jgi:uncharacterized protein
MPIYFTLLNTRTGQVLVPRLLVAATFWSRFRGLQFRRPLPADEGLLIVPCRSIHTHWMRFTIFVVMLDRDGIVVARHPEIPPWRFLAGAKNVFAVLELTARELNVEVGDRLVLEPQNLPNSDCIRLPRGLRRLMQDRAAKS